MPAKTAKLSGLELAALELLRVCPGLMVPIHSRAKLRPLQRLRAKGLAVYRHGWYRTEDAPSMTEGGYDRPRWHPLPGRGDAIGFDN